MTVTKDTLVKDIVNLGPKAIDVLFKFGMGCIGCPASQMESIEDAADVHGIDLENLLLSLNTL